MHTPSDDFHGRTDQARRRVVGPGVLVEPAAIGVGFGAVAAAGWLFVAGGSGLPVLLVSCGAWGAIGLALGLIRVGRRLRSV